jgi:hypothetical protein
MYYDGNRGVVALFFILDVVTSCAAGMGSSSVTSSMRGLIRSAVREQAAKGAAGYIAMLFPRHGSSVQLAAQLTRCRSPAAGRPQTPVSRRQR